ncbi:MAG: hypothetical protein WC564_01915 [Patescibacteria group bacterium]|jgi:hypothetical protein
MIKKTITPKKVVAAKKATPKTAVKKVASDNHNCHCCSAVCGSRK